MGKGKLKKLLKKVGSKIVQANVFFALVPFKGIMVKQLSKAGVKLSRKDKKKVQKVAELFHKHIVKKHTLNSEVEYLNENGEENIVGAVAAIVFEIVKFIKGAIDKKKQGQPMSPEEKAVADPAEKIEKELQKKNIKPENIIDEDGTAQRDDGSIIKPKGVKGKNLLIYLGIGAGVLYVITKK